MENTFLKKFKTLDEDDKYDFIREIEYENTDEKWDFF